MQKIMFNDKYGLTDAVLAKRKTQTRRFITNKEMLEFIKKADTPASFYTIYECFMLAPGLKWRFLDDRRVMRYQKNETVAIAQSYADITPQVDWAKCMTRKEKLGWNNKMFVRAEDMPHHIRITKIRIERLQNISDEDCSQEGIFKTYIEKKSKSDPDISRYYVPNVKNRVEDFFKTPQKAYAALIDRISGKGTWERNPYVFVYDFELID